MYNHAHYYILNARHGLTPLTQIISDPTTSLSNCLWLLMVSIRDCWYYAKLGLIIGLSVACPTHSALRGRDDLLFTVVGFQGIKPWDYPCVPNHMRYEIK